MSERPKPNDDGGGESGAWERLDRDDELDDAVIAADDTGMLRNEANITVVEEGEGIADEGG